MNAPALLIVFEVVYVLALSVWVGGHLFVMFVLAPRIVQVLDRASAARLMRAVLPSYFAWAAMAGALALPALVGRALSFPELRGPAVGGQALALLAAILIALYNGNVLTPAIHEARDAGPDHAARASNLRRQSVAWNWISLGLGIGLLVAFVVGPRPQTPGIVEPSAEERVRRIVEEPARAPTPLRAEPGGNAVESMSRAPQP